MANFDIDKLKNNPYARIMMACGNTNIAIQGFIVDDFTITGSNSFNSIYELAGQEDIQKKLMQVQGAMHEIFKGRFGGALEGIGRIKSRIQTELQWFGSEIPIFNTTLLFISIRPGDDVRNMVADLYRAVYPEEGDSLETINPPLGYIPGKVGMWSISIGQWFTADKQVIRNVEFTFSKEVVSNGSPLYARGTVQFGPYHMPFASDILGYFKLIAPSESMKPQAPEPVKDATFVPGVGWQAPEI